MGTFANLLAYGSSEISEEKKEEYLQRVEYLFQRGGMMEVKTIEMCEKRVNVIKKASMHEWGMDFYYNYFEDACWENAGVSLDGAVWSEKIGWSQYNTAVLAAYVLWGLYIEVPSLVLQNGEPIMEEHFVGWINYLFGGNFSAKGRRPWKLFEAMRLSCKRNSDAYFSEDEIKRIKWNKLVNDKTGLAQYLEICVVSNGVSKFMEDIKKLCKGHIEKNGRVTLYGNYLRLDKIIKGYFDENDGLISEEKIVQILNIVKAFYIEDGAEGVVNNADALQNFAFDFAILPMPAFVVKDMAEINNCDFTELWERICEVVKYNDESEDASKEKPVLTSEMFGVTSDDLIPYWSEACDEPFSKELWKWFEELKCCYEKILCSELKEDVTLKWILEQMIYADEEYYRVWTFADFFEETIDNLHDQRYVALWILYSKLLHDPELETAGSVIFVPEGSEFEKIGLHYLGKAPRRRLLTNWDMMDIKKKNNKARVTLRRYMALVANRKLREKYLDSKFICVRVEMGRSERLGYKKNVLM